MKFVVHDLKRNFVMPLKTNRKVALSIQDKKNGCYERVDQLSIEPNTEMTIYLEGVDFALKLVKQVFTNADSSSGILYLVSSDLNLIHDDITTIYQKRWNVEPYHQSLKQNASLSKSPTRTVSTQSNHFFAALCSYIKLEMLKVKTKSNHFALKSKLYRQALPTAFDALHVRLCVTSVTYGNTTTYLKIQSLLINNLHDSIYTIQFLRELHYLYLYPQINYN